MDNNPLKKSWVSLKQDVKKLMKVAPNNKLDFYALENFELTGSFSPDDISYEICKYNDETLQLELGVDLKEYLEHIQQADFMREFKLLIGVTETLSHKGMMIKQSLETMDQNRYPHIIPFDHNKVCICQNHPLTPLSNSTTSTQAPATGECYINASFINSIIKDDKKAFIATQGPTDKTIHSFWKMILRWEVNLIIMLCSLKETTRVQCERYWPADYTTELCFDDVKVQMIKEEEITKDLIKRIFMVEDMREANGTTTSRPGMKDSIASNGSQGGYVNRRLVMQLHFIGWPDHITPKKDHPAINVLLESINSEHQYSRKPIVIHCSGGIGRSGSLITIYNLFLYFKCLGKWVKYHNASLDDVEPKYRRISIFSIIRRLRQQRWGMVLSPRQYQFIYEYAVHLLEKNEDMAPLIFK